MCAVDEIGKNSVIPSTIPNMILSKILINPLLFKSKKNYNIKTIKAAYV